MRESLFFKVPWYNLKKAEIKLKKERMMGGWGMERGREGGRREKELYAIALCDLNCVKALY